jgi:hypothetical protein
VNVSGLGLSRDFQYYPVHYHRCWQSPAAHHPTVRISPAVVARRPCALDATSHTSWPIDSSLSLFLLGESCAREGNPIECRKNRHNRIGRLIRGGEGWVSTQAGGRRTGNVKHGGVAARGIRRPWLPEIAAGRDLPSAMQAVRQLRQVVDQPFPKEHRDAASLRSKRSRKAVASIEGVVTRKTSDGPRVPRGERNLGNVD